MRSHILDSLRALTCLAPVLYKIKYILIALIEVVTDVATLHEAAGQGSHKADNDFSIVVRLGNPC